MATERDLIQEFREKLHQMNYSEGRELSDIDARLKIIEEQEKRQNDLIDKLLLLTAEHQSDIQHTEEALKKLTIAVEHMVAETSRHQIEIQHLNKVMEESNDMIKSNNKVLTELSTVNKSFITNRQMIMYIIGLSSAAAAFFVVLEFLVM